MKIKSGSISRTLEVNLVVKADTKPNRIPKAIPPRPTTKNRATPRKTSTGSTTGMSATKLNMLYKTCKIKHTLWRTEGKTHSKTKCYVLFTAFNLILNIYSAPRHGDSPKSTTQITFIYLLSLPSMHFMSYSGMGG